MAQDGCVDKQDVCGKVPNTEKLKTITRVPSAWSRL